MSRVSPAFAPLTFVSEVLGHAVLESQLLVDAQGRLVQLADLAVASLDDGIDDQQIAKLSVSVGLGHDLSVGRQQPAFFQCGFLLA